MTRYSPVIKTFGLGFDLSYLILQNSSTPFLNSPIASEMLLVSASAILSMTLSKTLFVSPLLIS